MEILNDEQGSVKQNELSSVVQAIDQLRFEGDVIPHAWSHAPVLRHPSGKVNDVAIRLLANICYWYRPTRVLDEATNQIVAIKTKFHADKLQKSYEAWGKSFGYTKRQVQDAVTFLKKAGLITVEYRTITVSGIKMSNVVFIEPVPDAIRAITFIEPPPITLKRDTPTGKTRQPQHHNVKAPTLERETNTKSTPKNKQRLQQQQSVEAAPVVVDAHASSNGNDSELEALTAALMEAGYTPKSSAQKAAREAPELARAWLADVQAKPNLKNPGGYLHKRINSGEFPPSYAAESPAAPKVPRKSKEQRRAEQSSAYDAVWNELPAQLRDALEREQKDKFEYIEKYHPNELAFAVRQQIK